MPILITLCDLSEACELLSRVIYVSVEMLYYPNRSLNMCACSTLHPPFLLVGQEQQLSA